MRVSLQRAFTPAAHIRRQVQAYAAPSADASGYLNPSHPGATGANEIILAIHENLHPNELRRGSIIRALISSTKVFKQQIDKGIQAISDS